MNVSSHLPPLPSALRGLMLACLTLAAGRGAGLACHLGSRVHVPPGLEPDAPLVVALHGCTQTASAFEHESGWSTLADRYGFVVLYPEQPTCKNSFRCFSWFDPAQIERGRGEIGEIAVMVAAARAEYSIDPTRVYVTGFSAGAGMAVALMASYPEVYQAGAILAGLPFKIASGPNDAFPSMLVGKDLSPEAWAEKVRAEHDGYPGPYPRLVAFHGMRDRTVNPVNTTELVDQWTALHGADQDPEIEDLVAGHPRQVYEDPEGRPVVTTFRFADLGHEVPVDPGDGPDQGGHPGEYAKDADLLAAYQALVSFGVVGRVWP